MIERIKTKILHQIRFYIINGFSQGFQKLIEILFVQKNFMSLITAVIETFLAFCQRNKIIMRPGGTHIKEVRSEFSRFKSFTVNRLVAAFLIGFVCHRFLFVRF